MKEQNYITYSRTTYVGVLLFALPALLMLKVLSTWLNRTEYSAMRNLTAGMIKGIEIDILLSRFLCLCVLSSTQEFCAVSPFKFSEHVTVHL